MSNLDEERPEPEPEPTCACGCGLPRLRGSPTGGRPALYATHACRQRVFDRRQVERYGGWHRRDILGSWGAVKRKLETRPGPVDRLIEALQEETA